MKQKLELQLMQPELGSKSLGLYQRCKMLQRHAQFTVASVIGHQISARYRRCTIRELAELAV